MALLTSLSMINANGMEIPLINGSARTVTQASGLAAISSREVVIARSGRTGSRNLTRYRDDAPIVINGLIVGADADDLWAQYDEVAGVCANAIDTDRLLKWTAGNSLPLQRNVRLTSFDGPLEVGPDIISYQVTLRASDPNAYSQALYSVQASPLAAISGGGMMMPFTFPFTYNPPAQTQAGFTNAGFVSTPPVFTLIGRLVDPIIRLDTDTQLVFNGTVSGSNYLLVDVADRTILLNGTSNRRNLLDTANSTWFELPPGTGSVTLLATDWTAGATLTMQWRDART